MEEVNYLMTMSMYPQTSWNLKGLTQLIPVSCPVTSPSINQRIVHKLNIHPKSHSFSPDL